MINNKRYAWYVVAMLWVVALLNYMDRQVFSTMRPSMQVNIQALHSATYFGYLMAIFLWVYGLMSPISGMIADKINRKKIIVGSLLVWSSVTFLMSYAQTYHQLFFLRALMGVSEALYLPAALSMIADYHSSKNRSLAIGIHMTGLYAGQALGGFGATIAARFSWQITFHIFGIVGIVYAFFLLLFLRDKRPIVVNEKSDPAIELDQRNPIAKSFSLFKIPSFLILLFYFAIPSLPGWGVKNWLPTLFSENLHIGMDIAGPIATIAIAASSLMGVLLGGILSDKWVQRNFKGRMYTSAIGLALMIPSLLIIGYGQTLFHFVFAAVCFGIGYGMFDANSMPILCQFVPQQQRATAYGFMNMVGVFAGALITNTLGKSTDAGHLGKDFAVLSIFIALAIVVQLYFLKPKGIDNVN
jgi:MFS family permease